MCPFCLTTFVVMAAGATSIAGLVPFAMFKAKPRPISQPEKRPLAAERQARQKTEWER